MGNITGFYIPASISSDYVKSKRNEQGSLAYEADKSEVGIAEQSALQSLTKDYESTVENAYASYLANKRNIAMSNMGQGYKNMYNELAGQNLQSDITQNTATFAENKAAISEQANAARSAINKEFETEVANLDKVAASFDSYRKYLESLTIPITEDMEIDDDTQLGMFTPDELKMSTEDMYGDLTSKWSQIAKGYRDENDLVGMSYNEWLNTQYMNNTIDSEWYNWFLSGGYNDFLNSLAQRKTKSNLTVKKETENQKEKEQESDTKNENDYVKNMKQKVADFKKRIGIKSSSGTGGGSTW